MHLLDHSINSLRVNMVEMFNHYPPMETIWSSMSQEEQAVMAYTKVEEVVEAVKEGETCLRYPSLNDWSNIQFHPAYGLLPLMEEPKMSQISKNKLHKVMMVLDVILKLLISSCRTTKRDIFYQHFCEFSSAW